MKKKKENGSSIISILLLVCIIAGVLLIGKILWPKSDKQDLAYKNYMIEEGSIEENEAVNYYYNQLEEPEKIMYATILANEDKLKTGNEKIDFPADLSDSIKETGGSSENNYFQTAWDAISLDHLDLFYVNTDSLALTTRTTSALGFKSYEFTLKPKDGISYYNSTFTSKEQVIEAMNDVEAMANTIVAGARGSRYDKIKYVHDWIVDNVEYDTKKLANNDNIYGTFVNKKVVCEGYAEGLKYLLDKLNIPCVLVYGTGYDSEGKSEAHAWNYVKMEDDKWYAVDPTWDDPIYANGSAIFANLEEDKHQYFLKGAKTFNKNHVSDGDVSETGQDFVYPELSETDYKR